MRSKANNQAYEDGWDRIFGKTPKPVATKDRRKKYEEKADKTMRTAAKRRK